MEQPLPPYGACLLGSFNLTKYVEYCAISGGYWFNWTKFRDDITPVVRALDNVISKATFPLQQQAVEAADKRRMGIGVTGLANAGEAVAGPYGSPDFVQFCRNVMSVLVEDVYRTSIQLGEEKGSFKKFDKEEYLKSKYLENLPDGLGDKIKKWIGEANAIRNSHLISIAPTGTISLCADNVSGGIEPVFRHEVVRTVQTESGPIEVELKDYGLATFGVKGKSIDEVSVADHLNVVKAVAPYVDSAISKTINIANDTSWSEFKDIYTQAWESGLKGITVFNPNGQRKGILKAKESKEDVAACYIDPETNVRTCDE